MSWYDNTHGIDNQPWRSRHHPPPRTSDSVTGYEVSGLSPDQWRRMIAHHEAGHAVADLGLGKPVEAVLLSSGPNAIGATVVQGDWRSSLWDHVRSLATGERAADAYLHRAGLHTPTRGWAVELGASVDRRAAEGEIRAGLAGGRLMFGGYTTHGRRHAGAIEYEQVCDDADAWLSAHWPQVQAVAETLQRDGRLSAAQVAAAAQMPNTYDPARHPRSQVIDRDGRMIVTNTITPAPRPSTATADIRDVLQQAHATLDRIEARRQTADEQLRQDTEFSIDAARTLAPALASERPAVESAAATIEPTF